jgi:hypothetical protein
MGGARGKSCKDFTPPLSLTPATPYPPINIEPPPRCTIEPHWPVPARPQPLSLSLEARGHLELPRADQGAEVKLAPATTPLAAPNHRRRCPITCCHPRRPLVALQPVLCPLPCTLWTPRAA